MPRIVTEVQRRLGQLKAGLAGQIARHPDHHAVIAEALHQAQDHHAKAELAGLLVLDQQFQGGFLGRLPGLGHEDLRLVQ
jgi:hypothetical protein